MKSDLKTEKYPNGALFYVVDYSEDDNEIYRIGITDDMTKRKKIYDTHMLHKRKVILKEEVKTPIQLEMCVRSLLFDYRYRDNKDFFECNKKTVEKAIIKCKKNIKSVIQTGGSDMINKYNSQIKNMKNKLKILKKEISDGKIYLDNLKRSALI